ncbi:MAG TPA: hypothetical protein VFT71_06425 [Candidatus Nitrosocosmicus sp.]|nr:hypothetical protein [Candidatus Nitrosocosmicus sp.]
MHIVSKTLQLFSIIVILTMSLPAMFTSTISYQGVDMLGMEPAFAQLSGDNNTNIIQLTSTSSYTDEFGNFHIIGEVNNTSTQPQTNIVVTAILSNTSTNVIIGNYSAFSSIETLRSGELSPFDIVIQNPQQILGTFNFMEFSTTSQPAPVEKPANLVLNGSSSFVDNAGNPHIIGNIINQGQSPEQLLNLAITFYDNSSLGVVGTQSFGLNVGSLTNNQMAPFDITIIDNKTKSLAAFYSLNVDSAQSSMSPPLNPKFTFSNGGFTTEQFVTDELAAPFPPLLPLTNNNQGSNDNDNDNDNNDDNSGSSNSGSGGDLDCEDIDERNFYVGNNDPNNFDGDGDGIGCEEDDINGTSGGDLDCEDIDERNFPVGANDPNNFDGDGDGIGCEAEDLNNTNGTSNEGDLDCADIQETNITVGIDDPNNLDADGDGIGCESEDSSGSSGDLNCSDIKETNIAVGSNDPNNLDADGDGTGCETNETNDAQTNNDESNDNESNIEDSNPCTAEEASRDHTCTSSSGDNDEIDDWTDPPAEEEGSDTTSENEDQGTTSEESPNSENESDNNNDNEESNSEESNDSEDNASNDESNGDEENN